MARILTAVVLVALLLMAFACGGEEGLRRATPGPSTSAAPSPTMRPDAATHQLTYVGADGALWLVNGDGTGRTRLADVCFHSGETGVRDIVWSPKGDKLAVSCLGPISYTDSALMVLDESGSLLAEIKGETASPRWSPDGRRLAYEHWEYVGGGYPMKGAPLLQNLGILDLATLETTTLAEHVHLLAWPLPDRILVGLNAKYGEDCYEYDANWLNPDTGQAEPVPRLNNDVGVWPTMDGKRAVVTAPRCAHASESGLPLSIYDFGTGQEMPIPGSSAGVHYQDSGSSIYPEWLTISEDSSKLYWLLYWVTAGDKPVALASDVYRANMDGSGLIKLAPLPLGGLFGLDLCRFGLALSGDGLAAVYQGECPGVGKIVVQDLETGARVEVGEGFGSLGWHPLRSVDVAASLRHQVQRESALWVANIDGSHARIVARWVD